MSCEGKIGSFNEKDFRGPDQVVRGKIVKHYVMDPAERRPSSYLVEKHERVVIQPQPDKAGITHDLALKYVVLEE